MLTPPVAIPAGQTVLWSRPRKNSIASSNANHGRITLTNNPLYAKLQLFSSNISNPTLAVNFTDFDLPSLSPGEVLQGAYLCAYINWNPLQGVYSFVSYVNGALQAHLNLNHNITDVIPMQAQYSANNFVLDIFPPNKFYAQVTVDQSNPGTGYPDFIEVQDVAMALYVTQSTLPQQGPNNDPYLLHIPHVRG